MARGLLEPLGCSEGYLEYLNVYTQKLLEEIQVNWRASLLNPYMKDGETVALQLTSEQQASFTRATFYTFRSEGEHSYVLLENAKNCTLSPDGLLSMPLDQGVVFFTEKHTGKRIAATAIEPDGQEQHEGYRVVNVPIFLCKKEVFQIFESVGVYLQIGMDLKIGDFQILDIIPISADEDVLQEGKQIFRLEEWKSLAIFCFNQLLTYDRQGELLPFGEWETGEMVYWEEISMENGFALEIGRREDTEELLYGMFVLKDTQANLHASELVLLQGTRQEQVEQEQKDYQISVHETRIDVQTLKKKKPSIYKGDMVQIHIAGMHHTYQLDALSITLELLVENISRENVATGFEILDIYINGMKMDGYYVSAETILPGETLRKEVTISRELHKFHMERIESFESIDLVFRSANVENKAQAMKGCARVKLKYMMPDLQNKDSYVFYAASYIQKTVLWETGKVKATLESCYFDGTDYQMNFLFENNAEIGLYFALGEFTYNGTMGDPWETGIFLEPGKKGYSWVKIQGSMLHQKGLLQLEEIGFLIKAADGFISYTQSFRSDRVVLPLRVPTSETVLLDEKGIKLVAKSLHPNLLNGGLRLKISITNSSNRDVEIGILLSEANGVSVHMYNIDALLAGKSMLTEMPISKEVLRDATEGRIRAKLCLRVTDCESGAILLVTPTLHIEEAVADGW